MSQPENATNCGYKRRKYSMFRHSVTLTAKKSKKMLTFMRDLGYYSFTERV